MTPDAIVDIQALPARERVLATALALFYRDGIRATGIDRVIAEASVTKVTFYRHFPSKDALVVAFLESRHARWMTWFRGALARHAARTGADRVRALTAALREWFATPAYRGCAFVNSVAELGGTSPEVLAIARRHKRDMTAVIAGLMPPRAGRARRARALAVAVDGAIVRAQIDGSPDEALDALNTVIGALTRAE
jgi:AcrR family transcriptional regulator